jgi:hypothetical protein
MNNLIGTPWSTLGLNFARVSKTSGRRKQLAHTKRIIGIPDVFFYLGNGGRPMQEPEKLEVQVKKAVAAYWKTRQAQFDRQGKAGGKDQGARSAVTGGAQMDGFVSLITKLIIQAGGDRGSIFYNKRLELPGFFRPTKEWDLLVVKDGQLIVAIETKSQVGPSFGNNFNNRTEEAMGSALDLWTAYKNGAYNTTVKPWLGYVFLLEDCEKSQSPITVQEPHFKVFPEFKGASYAKRYELFCRKIMREQLYNVAAYLLSNRQTGRKGAYSEPAEDMTFNIFTRSLASQIAAFGGGRQ